MTASLLRSAPISTAASRPTSGWPTIAACPPAAVTAATMLSDSDRAPDSTATVPRGNEAGSRSGQRFRERQQTFRVGKHVVGRRHGRAGRPPTDLPGYRRHLAAQVFYLLSTVRPTPIQAHRRRHSSTFRLIRIIDIIRKYVRYDRVNTRPPTPSSGAGPRWTFPLIDGDIDKCHHSMLYSSDAQ